MQTEMFALFFCIFHLAKAPPGFIIELVPRCARARCLEAEKEKETMKSTTKTLTEGPLAKQILLVSLPLALSNLLQVLFNMSDVAVVGRFAGSTALGAVGSTSILVTLFTGFLIGLSNGINVLVARFYGARHTADVQKTVHSAAIVSLIAGVALLFIGLLGSPAMLRLLNTKDDLLPGAILYLRVYFLGMPALALYNFGNAVFSSIGDTKKPLIYLSLAGALNIVLNLFFVIVCRLSVVGVALASAISQCVSAALILRALTRAQDCYALDVHQLHLDPATTKSILALGVPAGFQNAIFAIANLFIQAGVNSFDSLMVKGNSAAANADNMIYDCMAAFYMACASFMSQNYGAGKRSRIWGGVKVAFGLYLIWWLIAVAFSIFIAPYAVRLITGSTNPTVIDNALLYVRISTAMFPPMSFLVIMRNALQGMRHQLSPLLCSVLELIGKVIFAFWIVPVKGYIAVCICEPVTWVICFVFIAGAALMFRNDFKDKAEASLH